MEIISIFRGRKASYDLTLQTADGETYTGFTGAEALAVILNRGGGQPALSPAPTATWTDPANGLARVDFQSACTASLEPARYFVEVTVTASGQDPISAVMVWLDVKASAASDAAPTCYSTYQDLVKLYPKVGELLSEEEQSLFEEQRHAGHEFINRALVTRYASWLERQRLSDGYRWDAPRLSAFTGYLAAGDLVVDDVVREVEARYALYLILDWATSTSTKDSNNYRDLAMRNQARVHELLDGLRVRVTDVASGTDFYLDADQVIWVDQNVL